MSEDNNIQEKEQEKFYLTTPIYYPSAKLHIGHSYTTVAADCIARYQRMNGKEVMFLTGMDEHGQKIQQKAIEQGMDPQSYVDKMALGIKELWKLMNISYDQFIRTTDEYHVQAVQAVFTKLFEQGDIYKGFYEGWYCTSCEAFWTESQLVDGKCPDSGDDVVLTKEESYFFKLSKYGYRILELYENNPNFLKPDKARNEMTNFIKAGLEDLAVTRSSFDWGIEVPFDREHVIYVWVDALVNYISALGYPDLDSEKMQKFWPANIHLIGKEIVRFHCIIWPAVLMALGIEVPQRVFAHGWLLLNNSKMSKSKGNVVDPVILCERYGVDAIRYFLLREVAFGSDGNFSNEALVERINSDLANDLGNLLSRTTAMINKYFDGLLPTARSASEFDQELSDTAEEAIAETREHLDNMEFSKALDSTWKLVRRANKYIDETQPWILAKDEAKLADLANVLANLCESLRITAILIQSAMPDTSAAIFRALGIDEIAKFADAKFSEFTYDKKIESSEPLFPRLNLNEEMAWLDEMINKNTAEIDKGAQVSENKKSKGKSVNLEDEKENFAKANIEFSDFEKLDLQVATVLECEKHENADKLLKFKLETKNSEIRTVVSGLAKHYKPENLVGKQVVLLANLEPRKIRGVLSEGMILSAEDEDGSLKLLTVDSDTVSGAEIG